MEKPKNQPKIPVRFKWDGYICFAVYWFSVGNLFLILTRELFDPSHGIMLVLPLIESACWTFNAYLNRFWADIRNARRVFEYWEKVDTL